MITLGGTMNTKDLKAYIDELLDMIDPWPEDDRILVDRGSDDEEETLP